MIFEKPVGAKRYYFGKSKTLFVAAAIITVLPFIAPNIDTFGRNFAFVLAGLLFITAIYNYWCFKKSTTDEKVYEMPMAAPPDMQMKYLKKMVILSYFIYPILTVITAWELKEFEVGKANSTELWQPFLFIYNHAGYWPTVLSILIAGATAIRIMKVAIDKHLKNSTINFRN